MNPAQARPVQGGVRPTLALGALLAAGALAAQERRFEVASLKRNTFNAYRPQSTELVGAPGWLADRHDLIAKTTGPSTSEQRAAMLRALLAEELQLRAHYEMREQRVFDLVFARRDRSLRAGIIRTDRDCAAANARHRSRRSPVGAVNTNERDSVPLATCEARRCQPEDLPNRQ